jgi:hypothetical protein
MVIGMRRRCLADVTMGYSDCQVLAFEPRNDSHPGHYGSFVTIVLSVSVFVSKLSLPPTSQNQFCGVLQHFPSLLFSFKNKINMADDEDIAALVVDNGSGMCKGAYDKILLVGLFR